MSGLLGRGAASLRRLTAAALLFTACALVATAWVLFKPGTLGHHWDWLIPPSAVELRALTHSSSSAWQNVSLGSFVSYRSTSAVLAMALGAPGFLGASGALVSKGLVLLSLIGSSLAMYGLISDLHARLGLRGDSHRYGIVGGILYGFAPFAYDQIVAGDQLEFVAYAIAPLAVLSIVNSADGSPYRQRMWMVAAALALAVMSASPQTAAITMVIGAALAWSTSRSISTLCMALAGIAVLTFGLCAFWLVPVAFSGGAVSTGIATTPQAFADAGILSMRSPYQTLTATAEPGLFYFHALPGFLTLTFAAAWIAAWALIVVALASHKSRPLAMLAWLYAVGALIPLGGAPLIGPLIAVAYHAAMPASLLFRTAQHLVFLPAFVAPPLIALSAATLDLLEERRGRIVAALCALAICAGFIVRSDYLGLIGPFTDGRSVDEIAALTSEPTRYRLLFLPASGSYYFHPGVFDYFFEAGDDPSVRFSQVPAVVSGFKWTPYHRSQALEQALDELTLQNDREDEKALLFKLASIGYVSARGGVMPSGGSWVERFDFNQAVRTTDANPTLRRVASEKGVASWISSAPVPRVYTPDCTIAVPASADIYDFLPWSRQTGSCRLPAFIASSQNDETIVDASAAVPRSTVGTASNRWDVYYFGNENVRPAVQNTETFQRRGAVLPFEIRRATVYDVYARLETGSGFEPVALAVDGQPAKCIDPASPATRTEDVIHLQRSFLEAGPHSVRLRRCRAQSSGPFQILAIDVVPSVAIRPSVDRSSVDSVQEGQSAFSVVVKGRSPTYVVLNDAYDERWIARQNGKILAHTLANGYANAWRVEHPADGTIDIEFLPQRNVLAGFQISAIVLVGAFAFVLKIPEIRVRWPRAR